MSSRRIKAVSAVALAGLVAAAGVWVSVRSEPAPRQSAPVAVLPTATESRPEPMGPMGPMGENAPLELSLRLIGTTVAEDPARHRAVIIDFERNRRQVARIDDRLLDYDAVFVREIEPLRVRLDVEGEERWLTLDLETPVEPRALRMPVEWWSTLEDRDFSELTEEEQQELVVEGIRKLARMQLGRREPALQPTQGVFAPWQEEGELVGLFASQIAQGGLFDQLGLEPYDIIHDVNGVRLYVPEDTYEVMERLAHDSEIRIHITRNGEPMTIESHLAPQILEDLGGA